MENGSSVMRNGKSHCRNVTKFAAKLQLVYEYMIGECLIPWQIDWRAHALLTEHACSPFEVQMADDKVDSEISNVRLCA